MLDVNVFNNVFSYNTSIRKIISIEDRYKVLILLSFNSDDNKTNSIVFSFYFIIIFIQVV